MALPAWPPDLPRRRVPAPSLDPLVVEGDRAWIRATTDGGPNELRLHPVTVACDMRVSLPPGSDALLAPGALRRTVVVNGAVVEESLLAFQRLPAAVLQWDVREGDGDERGLELHVEWTVPGGGEPRIDEQDGSLSLPCPGEGVTVRYDLSGAEGSWSWDHDRGTGSGRARERGGGPGPRIFLDVSLGPDEPITLFVTCAGVGSERASRAARKRLGTLDRELSARASASRRAEREDLTIELGRPELEKQLAWAHHRLIASAPPPAGEGTRRVVTDHASLAEAAMDLPWLGLGLLALGRHGAAGRVAERSLSMLEEDGGPGAGALLHLHFLSRFALWTGQAWSLRRLPLHRDEWWERMLPPDGGGAAFVGPVLDGLADAVEAVGDRSAADDVRQRTPREQDEDRRTRAEGLRPASSDLPGPSRSRPDAPEASGPAGTSSRLLAGALHHGGGPPPGPDDPAEPDDEAIPPDGFHRGLLAWERWNAGDPDRAAEAWASAVGRAAHGDPADRVFLRSATAAMAAAPLLFGLLGAGGDAFYGRLRLAPRIPARWKELRIRGIRLSDSRVGIDYRREGNGHAFRLLPIAGRVPLNLVFEPLLPAGEIADVRIDGATAEVDLYRFRGRAGLRVQLPLDRNREIVVRTEGAE